VENRGKDQMTTKKCYADLHVHTFYSDSTFSPEDVVKTAHKTGIDTIAITDHDCVDGIAASIEQGKKYGVNIIPGIEMTVEKDKNEVHILGYFIDWKAHWFREKLEIIKTSRVKRMHKMIELLKEKGIKIDPEAVFKLSGKGSVGRLHLALTMFRARKIRTIQEAFRKYIGFRKPCYVPHTKFSPKDAIKMVLKTGGVPVLAHPRLLGDDDLIPEFVGYGLRGIEVYHTDHNVGTREKYLKIAEENNLLVTGGSDCHGLGKGHVLIGTVKVDCSLVEKLEEEAKHIRGL